jgi:hypothetical protein
MIRWNEVNLSVEGTHEHLIDHVGKVCQIQCRLIHQIHLVCSHTSTFQLFLFWLKYNDIFQIHCHLAN